jgi:hypothetical protein
VRRRVQRQTLEAGQLAHPDLDLPFEHLAEQGRHAHAGLPCGLPRSRAHAGGHRRALQHQRREGHDLFASPTPSTAVAFDLDGLGQVGEGLGRDGLGLAVA